ncbi:hypothetical protein KUTeg_023809 [Tegillarca granosa]|uniref:Uncharacterized protein n=1 Tax=Tegillarca granosa TaxID=220873 RepID=A0ABQ9E2Q9_TEGGR|nr:hypothetical protein KUTeg_023809 [Tegillarca granosa]
MQGRAIKAVVVTYIYQISKLKSVIKNKKINKACTYKFSTSKSLKFFRNEECANYFFLTKWLPLIFKYLGSLFHNRGSAIQLIYYYQYFLLKRPLVGKERLENKNKKLIIKDILLAIWHIYFILHDFEF